MQLNDIIEKLKINEAFKYMLLRDPICIFVTGSYTQGIVDERSDLDLVCVVPDDSRLKTDFSFTIESTYIHWTYYYPKHIREFNTDFNTLWIIGGAQMHNLNHDQIIYIKEGFEDLVNELIISAHDNAERYMKTFIIKNTKLINNVLEQGLDVEGTKTKWLYHLCWMSHILENTEINIEKCAILKRIRWQEIPDEVKHYCMERMSWIKENYLS